MHIARPTSSRLSSMALSTHRLQLPLEIRSIASQKTRSKAMDVFLPDITSVRWRSI